MSAQFALLAALLLAAPSATADNVWDFIPEAVLKVQWKYASAVYGGHGSVTCSGSAADAADGAFVGSCNDAAAGTWLGGTNWALMALYTNRSADTTELPPSVTPTYAQFTFPITAYGTGVYGNGSFPSRRTRLRLDIISAAEYSGPHGPFGEYSVQWPPAVPPSPPSPNATVVSAVKAHCGAVDYGYGTGSNYPYPGERVWDAPVATVDVTLTDSDWSHVFADSEAVFRVPLQAPRFGDAWWTQRFIARVTSPDSQQTLHAGMCPISISPACGWKGVSVICPGSPYGRETDYHLSVRLSGQVRLELKN